MANRGARIGNDNAKKGKEWIDALRYALKSYESDEIKRGRVLKAIAKRVVADALDGKEAAWREIAERLDGKVAAQGTGSGSIKVLILRDNSNAIVCNAIPGETVEVSTRVLPSPDE